MNGFGRVNVNGTDMKGSDRDPKRFAAEQINASVQKSYYRALPYFKFPRFSIINLAVVQILRQDHKQWHSALNYKLADH